MRFVLLPAAAMALLTFCNCQSDTGMVNDGSGGMSSRGTAPSSGPGFGRAFVQHQIQPHQNNIQKIQTQLLPAAHEAQLRSYLQKTVKEMQGHLATMEKA